jgi:integral membrane protein
MQAALTRYRIVAWICGTGLLTLVLVGMPLEYLAGKPTMVAIVGPIHGFLFLVYLVLTFDLARRADWPLPRTLRVMASGTIPFLTFFTERKVTKAWISASPAEPPSTRP